MKVLSVVSTLPYPPDNGTRSTAWNFIRALNSIADVTVCTWVTGLEDPDHIAQVRSSVRELITLADGGGRPTWPERIGYRARSLMVRVPPYILEKRDRCEPMPELDGFDLAVAEEDAALMLMPPFRCPVVVHRHNIFPDTIKTLIASGALGTARKLKWISEMPMWRRYNRELSEKATVSIATTPEAAKSLQRVLPGSDVFVVCNGVEIPEEQLIPGPQPRGIFTGTMDYEPNADAAIGFVRDLWPKIVSEVPDASFQIIGRNPFGKVLRLRGQGVDVIGEVPDMFEACRGGRLGIVPLRAGSGIKTKTMELMAMGLPVVTTPMGAEGLSARDSEGLLVRTDDASFCDAVVDLMRDQAKAVALGDAARRYMSDNMTWDLVAARYVELIPRIATRRVPS